MGLRFILGGSGAGKSDRMLEEIKAMLTEHPKGAPIFYIVPDQMTFQQEYKLFNNKQIQGSIRAQVISFSRLAWRVLQETGGATRNFISSVGVQMMLRKIIEEKQGDWHVFQKAMEKQGFLEQIEGMVTEFKRYQITPEILQMEIDEINRFVHKESSEQALVGKLSDLQYIYEKLLFALKDNYIDSEDQLQLLAEKISDANSLHGADIYINGFHRFTPQELLVVEELMKKANSVTIGLTLGNPSENTSEMDLFYQTSETYHAIRQTAEENNIQVAEDLILHPEENKGKNRPYFLHLEKNFDVRPAPAYEGSAPIQIAEAVHPRAEVEGAAQEMIRLVREENYRFQDIAIFTRQSEVYHDLIETVFSDYGIPVFIDEKKSMLNHPLNEFIRSILDMIEGDWRYDAVFRALKTGFIPAFDDEFPLTNDAVDELENYVLEYGIRTKKRWISEDEWQFERFRGFDRGVQTDAEKQTQKRINTYRRQITRILGPFDEQMKQAKTIRELCEVLYTLLEEIQVPSQLEYMRNYFDENGEIEKGREQDQVWDAVIGLLDEMVEMAGDEKMTLSTFRSALEAGLETLTFSHVPPSIDQIIVATVDRSRLSGVKCVFLLGVNEGVWPMKPDSDGVINERERELLADHGIRLADSSKQQLLDDWFYMYLVFTAGMDQLYISYPLSDEEGKAKMPSQLIKRMEELFPSSREHILYQDPDELLEADRFITTPVKTRGALTMQLARYQRGYPMKDIWWHVLNWYIKHFTEQGITYKALQSLYYQNLPSDLAEETVENLYPRKVKASVSRLETYYRCSYQHFAKYSLGLEERQTYKLEAPDIGQLFHEALKQISEWIQAEGRDFAALTEKETNGYAKKAVDGLAPVLQHQILRSSNRYKYIQEKLESVIARAAFILSEQARQSNFSPVGLELGFGEGETLPPLTLNLPNGYELILRGRIDRVDKAGSGSNLYLRIIDYKSSAKGIDLVEVYYGLALQMLAYLDVVLTYSEQWLGQQAEPAGVLYFHIHNPMISENEKLEDATIADKIFKEYKMKGLLLSQEEIVRMMDTSLETGTSQIIPAGFKKDGAFNSNSKIASNDTFDGLKYHIQKLMEQAGIQMTEGVVDLNPFQHKQQVACTYCPFHAVCQFDPLLEENNYRKLREMKDDDILSRLSKEGKENG